VRQADQFPFRLHFLQAAERELAESALLFDLPDDRFDDRLSGAMDHPAHDAADGLPHARGERIISPQPRPARAASPVRRNEHSHRRQGGIEETLCVPIARVGQQDLRRPAQCGAGRRRQG